MKLYKTTIKANSNFATILKGDTIFGQICWYIELFKKGELSKMLENYDKKPFLIVSDAFISGYLPKPKMPSHFLGEDPDKKKENKKKTWLEIDDFFNSKFLNAKTQKELPKDKKIDIVRNSINYKLFKTDGGDFAPYSSSEYSFDKKDIYLLIDENYIDIVKKAFYFMGEDGFGKDKTIGKGRFEVLDFSEYKPPITKSRFFMSLSPIDIKDIECKNLYYDTFVRFGKLGMDRANTNPFKKPILFADSATVIEFDEEKELNYLGSAIKDISTYEDVVQQGYSILFAMELNDE